MLNIFKRNKRTENSEPQQQPLELEISEIVNRFCKNSSEQSQSDFSRFSEELKKWEEAAVFSFCNSSDTFPVTLFLKTPSGNINEMRAKLNELTGLEIIQYSYRPEDYEMSLWSMSTCTIHTDCDASYFILMNDKAEEALHSDSIEIGSSREFSFGKLLLGDLFINSSPVSVSFKKLLFSGSDPTEKQWNCFQSEVIISGREISFFYMLEKSSISAFLVKELVKEQKKKMTEWFGKEVILKKVGAVQPDSISDYPGYILEGKIHTTGADLGFKFLFPRKYINLFPDSVCTTIKGRVLQINRELFAQNFSTFYKPLNRLLMADFLSVIERRDLNLICQNLFVANSISGDDIRKLFFYKVKMEEKSRVLRIPFITSEIFLDHLPLRLKEDFQKSRAYSESYSELVTVNKNLMDKVYRNLSEGNLLLSYKARYILQKELGEKEKESKTRRLQKLVKDKRFINYLDRMDNKKVQVLLSNMKNVLIVDTFIYQTDELVKLKPYLSQRRFNELKEDIRFTQSKIKSNQIDISRISDSIEKFNSNVRDFLKKDQKNDT